MSFPVFSIFRELNKTAKLKGMDIDTITAVIGVLFCIGIV